MSGVKIQTTTISQSSIELKRTVGLPAGVSIILGTIVGSGIFVAPQDVLIHAGSIGLTLIIWLICGIVALLASLCYVELSFLMPQSGGDLIYISNAFGKLNRHLGDFLGFMYCWSNSLVMAPLAIAISHLSCATYMLSPFLSKCGNTTFILKSAAILILCFSCFINCYSVKLVNKILVTLTSTKTIGLFVIIIGGFVKLIQGYTVNLEKNIFADSNLNILSLATGFYGGLYCYDGWNNLNFLVEEIKNPKRNMLLSILISVPMITVVYTLVNLSYFIVMSKDEFLSSNAVAITWSNAVLGSVFSKALPIMVMLSTWSTGMAIMYASSRMSYSAARKGYLPSPLAMISINRLTPMISIIYTATIAMVYLVSFSSLGSLIEMMCFIYWTFYGLSFASLIIIRLKQKRSAASVIHHTNSAASFQLPIAIPFISLITAIYFVVAPFISFPKLEYLIAMSIVLMGVVAYFIFIYKEIRVPFIKKITEFIQTFFQVTMSDKPFDVAAEAADD